MKGIYGAARFAVAVALVAAVGQVQAKPVRYSFFSPMRGPGLGDDSLFWMPFGNLVVDPHGTAYGLAARGGVNDGGGVYAVSGTGDFSTYHELTLGEGREGPPDGHLPVLLRGIDGSLYGITNGNGLAADQVPPYMGTVFKVTPDGRYSTVHAFGGPDLGDGMGPDSLVQAPDGMLYGSTQDGAVFQLTTDGVEQVLHSFGAFNAPTAITATTDGNIVGAVDFPGGLPSPGIFKLTPDGSLTLLHSLNCDGGCTTETVKGLVTASDGTIYGVMSGGTHGNGQVFKLTTDGSFGVLHSFDDAGAKEGFDPQMLAVGSDGNLYGGTCCGGGYAGGTLFRVSPGGVFSILKRFDGRLSQEAAPFSLVQSGPRTFLAVATPVEHAGVYKLVVPIADDVDGSGAASAITFDSSSIGFLRFQADGTYQRYDVASGNGAYPVGTGDLDGDGIADTIVTDTIITNGTRSAYIWYGGTSAAARTDFIGPYPVGWRLVGTGDVNADGKDDLLWMNDGAHQFAYWTMDSTRRLGYKIFKITPGYFPVLTGDFNGDGHADVLWSSSRRDLYLWSGSGAGFTSKLINVYPKGWSIAGRGDLDGDGSDDIVWNTADHSKWGYWLMNGPTIRRLDSFVVPSGVAGYSIGDVADLNGDGVADLLWSNGTSASFQASQGSCSATTPCRFAAPATPVAWPSGQHLFNAGLATGGK